MRQRLSKISDNHFCVTGKFEFWVPSYKTIIFEGEEYSRRIVTDYEYNISEKFYLEPSRDELGIEPIKNSCDWLSVFGIPEIIFEHPSNLRYSPQEFHTIHSSNEYVNDFMNLIESEYGTLLKPFKARISCGSCHTGCDYAEIVVDEYGSGNKVIIYMELPDFLRITPDVDIRRTNWKNLRFGNIKVSELYKDFRAMSDTQKTELLILYINKMAA